MRLHATITLFALACVPLAVHAQLSTGTQSKIADIATRTLHDTGVPSASIGIVKDNAIAYTHAFGLAHIHPDQPAEADMAYPIGSISKQFTATAILLLQQDGKLSIDDPISKYFPELTRSRDIRIRNILTMTSGYEDYAPQDYIIPAWLHEARPIDVVHEWAEKPLDFEPGTQWQYSNTNFVLAALIVEKVSGQKLFDFLQARVFKPLHMKGVVNTYTQRDELQVTGYVSYAMAPVREQPLEAPGWYYGDGDLAMSAATLLTWDLSIINQTLLSPASYAQMETSMKLKDGTDSHYGLGIFVTTRDGHRTIEHSGEVGGFVAENVVGPDDHIAITVLTNEVASSAASLIAQQVKPLLVASAAPAAAEPPDTFGPELKTVLTALQHQHIDRSLFTADCNAYFDQAALSDFASTLEPLGPIQSVTRVYVHERGGMTGSLYTATFAKGGVKVSIYLMPNGKIEQLLVVGKA